MDYPQFKLQTEVTCFLEVIPVIQPVSFLFPYSFLISIFNQKMASSAFVLKDASLQLKANFEVDFCMLEWEYYWLNRMLPLAPAYPFCSRKMGTSFFYLTFAYPDTSLVAEKRN